MTEKQFNFRFKYFSSVLCDLLSFKQFEYPVCLFLYIVNFSSRFLRFGGCGVGGALLLCGLIVLTSIDQDDGRHSCGHTGGTCIALLEFQV